MTVLLTCSATWERVCDTRPKGLFRGKRRKARTAANFFGVNLSESLHSVGDPLDGSLTVRTDRDPASASTVPGR